MERLDAIIAHPLWQSCCREIQEQERDRIFCGHSAAHFLDVARLAWLENLEAGLGLDRQRIYAAALLHDIGRAEQYLHGTPHHEAGAALARRILTDCDFPEEEIREVEQAIASHRDKTNAEGNTLSALIYRADKASRMCMLCPSREQCNWPDSKKNLRIIR